MKKKFFAPLVLLVQLQACGQSGVRTETITVNTEQGSYSFTVEIAATARERQKGLMDRATLGDRQGMLFIFPALSLNSFWMKNTPLSLDIIFIGEEGTIQEIAAGTTPYSEDLITPSEPYLYVLEVKAGVSEELSLKSGDSVDLPR